MIFKPELVRQIKAGRKTQTRRRVQGDKACTYKPGKSYAVQPGRGKPSDGLRIMVSEVRHELVGAITFEDARREGFKTTADFKRYWLGLYDAEWLTEEATDEEVVDRFEARHARKPVWVITFHVDQTERIRLLAERNVPADYVENRARAMEGEPEAVSEGELRRQKLDQVDRLERYAQQRQHLQAEDRARAAWEKAGARRIDVSHEFHVLRKLQGKGDTRAVVRQLRRIEDKVFRNAA